jgi:bifunctional DNase/RNase
MSHTPSYTTLPTIPAGNALGVSLDRAREQVIHVLTDSGASTGPALEKALMLSEVDAEEGQDHEDLTTEASVLRTVHHLDAFTERARNVLQYAQREAERFNHNYIGTEHLLLGMIRVREGVAAKVLSSYGIRLDRVRSGVTMIIGRGDRPLPGEIGLTSRARSVIEIAAGEKHRLGDYYIGTEHLLLGLCQEGEGVGAGILETLGISLDKVASRVIDVLGQSRTPSAQGVLRSSSLEDVEETPMPLDRETDRVRVRVGIVSVRRRSKGLPLKTVRFQEVDGERGLTIEPPDDVALVLRETLKKRSPAIPEKYQFALDLLHGLDATVDQLLVSPGVANEGTISTSMVVRTGTETQEVGIRFRDAAVLALCADLPILVEREFFDFASSSGARLRPNWP